MRGSASSSMAAASSAIAAAGVNGRFRPLDEPGEIVERRGESRFMVLPAYARRHVRGGDADLGARAGVAKRPGEDHLAGISGIVALEHGGLDDAAAGIDRQEAAVADVASRARLSGGRRLRALVTQLDP